MGVGVIGITNTVRKVATKMMNTSMHDIDASVINKWANELGNAVDEVSSHPDLFYVNINMAKAREALDEIRVAAMSDYEWDADYLIEKCNAALSAPARNCDVETVKEQRERFVNFCHSRKCKDCPMYLDKSFFDCAIRWSQMPYERREEKRNESRR